MGRARAYWVAASLLLARSLFSQTHNFRTFSAGDGLPQQFIYHISQSPKGYLFLSTGESLVRFDGTSFTTVSGQADTDDFVTCHHVDSSGVIWIGHGRNGVTRKTPESVSRLTHPGFLDLRTNAIIGLDSNTVAIATSGGLWTAGKHGLRKTDGPRGNIFSLCLASSGELLAATEDGLYFRQRTKGNFRRSIPFAGVPLRGIAQSPGRDEFWVLSQDGLVSGCRMSENGPYVFSEIRDFVGPDKTVSCLYADFKGDLWISLESQGLVRFVFHGNPADSSHTRSVITRENGLPADHIRVIFQDREGTLWLGTFGEGLLQKKSQDFTFYGAPENVIHNNIRKVSRSTDGGIWLADRTGVALYNPVTRAYEYFPSGRFFDGEEVNTLLCAPDGVTWVGTSASVYTFCCSGRRSGKVYPERGAVAVQVNDLQYTGGKVIAGTTHGILVFSGSGVPEHLRTNDGLLHNNVRSTFTDSRGRLWVCSHGAPPYYIFEQKIRSFKDLSGKNAFQINSVCEDREKNIWIATDGEGVYRYDDSVFTSYTTKEGLLSDYSNGIACDEAGNIWVTHGSGLSRLGRGKGIFSTYSAGGGLLYSEYNDNALFNAGPGGIWFGTTAGLVRYDPGEVHALEYVPEVFIESVKFNGTKTPPSGGAIVKEPGYYSVYVSFKAVSLNNPSAVAYKWRIPEADTTWKSTTMSYVDIPRLGEGKYTFEVTALDQKTGQYAYRPARLTFRILTPVWKSTWFFFLLFASTVALVVLVTHLRTRRLKRSGKLLQLKVKQKTMLLQREKEAVEKVKRQLEIRNKDVTDSITYAKRIQESLLPSDETIAELFGEDFFVLYKPKDIVSGDFYWTAALNVNNNNKKPLSFAAVIDCTGHGVPGAFLSIMANDLLKQSIINENVNNTDEILDYLNAEVSAYQSGARSRIRDGMDIAVIGITPDRRKLYYTGANNSVYIVRQANGHPELIELKPAKQPIGEDAGNVQRFRKQEVDLIRNDCVYLFSDGYADQFGGARNKKLTYKRFREILKSMSGMPMDTQHRHLERVFEEWRGTEEQTDDVCVMGIRI